TLHDFRGDVADRGKPDAARRVLRVGEELVEHRDARRLTTAGADVVSGEHEPGTASAGLVQLWTNLGEVAVVHLDAQGLRQIDERGIVGRLVAPAPSGEKEVGHDRHVALRAWPAPDEG